MSWLLLFAPVALAHPFALRVASHRADVVVQPDRVHVLYRVEVPVHSPADAAEVDPAEVLAAGVVVTVDGVSVPLEVRSARSVRQGHLAIAEATLQGPLATGPHALGVAVGGYPELPAWFTWGFAVDRRLAVTGTSLTDGDAIWEDRQLVGEAWRGVSVDLRPDTRPAAVLWRALTPGSPEVRTLSEALDDDRPRWFLATLAAQVLIGGGVALAPPPPRGVVALALLLAAPLALLPADGELAVLGGGRALAGAALVALAATAAHPSAARVAAVLGGAALAGSLGAPGPAAAAMLVLAAITGVASRGSGGRAWWLTAAVGGAAALAALAVG